jgi:hypothetical protein
MVAKVPISHTMVPVVAVVWVPLVQAHTTATQEVLVGPV